MLTLRDRLEARTGAVWCREGSRRIEATLRLSDGSRARAIVLRNGGAYRIEVQGEPSSRVWICDGAAEREADVEAALAQAGVPMAPAALNTTPLSFGGRLVAQGAVDPTSAEDVGRLVSAIVGARVAIYAPHGPHVDWVISCVAVPIRGREGRGHVEVDRLSDGSGFLVDCDDPFRTTHQVPDLDGVVRALVDEVVLARPTYVQARPCAQPAASRGETS